MACLSLWLCVSALFFFACANHDGPAQDEEPQITFDFSKFVICRSQPGVPEYVHAISVKASDQVLNLTSPPINESAQLNLWINAEGNVETIKTLNATSPGFGPIAIAAVEMSAPYPKPAKEISRCIIGKKLNVEVKAKADARCEHVEESTEWVLAVRDQINSALLAPEYVTAPGQGFAFLRLLFGPNGEVLESNIYEASNPAVEVKIERALSGVEASSAPPKWQSCFSGQAVTLKLEVFSNQPSS